MPPQKNYTCTFEVLAPISADSCESDTIDLLRADGHGGMISEPQRVVPLFVRGGRGVGTFFTCYRRPTGSLARFVSVRLPLRGNPADAEYDLRAYADRRHWLQRPRVARNPEMEARA